MWSSFKVSKDYMKIRVREISTTINKEFRPKLLPLKINQYVKNTKDIKKLIRFLWIKLSKNMMQMQVPKSRVLVIMKKEL